MTQLVKYNKNKRSAGLARSFAAADRKEGREEKRGEGGEETRGGGGGGTSATSYIESGVGAPPAHSPGKVSSENTHGSEKGKRELSLDPDATRYCETQHIGTSSPSSFDTILNKKIASLP